MTDGDKRLREEIAGRYLALNGDHPMSKEDDAYVTEYFISLEALAHQRETDADDIRRLMLAGLLPLPSYLRSDGTQMVPSDLLALADAAGGVEKLRTWFCAQFDNPATAGEEWEAYLSGQYVCLRQVSPSGIKRKDELCAALRRMLASPEPSSQEWLETLHELVDELDALEPPFAPYDRLRFGGPVSRDELIAELRRVFPREDAVNAAAQRAPSAA